MTKISQKLKVFLKSVLSITMGEVATDKATLIWDGEGELTEGTEVFIKDENEEVVSAADGDYKTADDKTIKVADGKVTEIVDPEAEVAPEASDAEAKFNSQKVEMSASYDEIRRNIQEAINNTGVNGWIVEAAADYAIVNVWTGERDVYFRYELTTNEDGTVVLGASSEVKPAFVPVEEPAAEPEPVEEPVQMSEETPIEEPQAEPADKPEEEEIVEHTIEERVAALEELANAIKGSLDAIVNGVVGLEDRVTSLEEKVAKVETEPAAEPVDETTVEEKETPKSKMSYLRKN